MTSLPSLPSQARSFFASILSRALAAAGIRERVQEEAKLARRLSCNGLEGSLAPCEHRTPSAKYPGSFLCGACGCGDKQAVLVAGDLPAYEKLDYPHLVCPIGMPGFSNYAPPRVDGGTNARAAFLEARFGVAPLTAWADEQARGFRVQRWIERASRAWREPRRTIRKLRRR